MPELVSLSPFTASDGSIFVAQKSARVIAVDPHTGLLQRDFDVHGSANEWLETGGIEDGDNERWEASRAKSRVDEIIGRGREELGASGRAGETSQTQSAPGVHNATLFISRTEYRVVCYDSHGVRWNMTYAEYAQKAAVDHGSSDLLFFQVQV